MDAFETAYKSLNPEQKRAVDTIEGPVMVIAGPGTGKTQMLTLRIANILKQTDTSPDSILALTFTEAGVISMRKRLTSIVGITANKIGIHTFHGFCRGIIEKYPEAFPHIIGAKPIDDAGRILLIQEALEASDAHLLRPLGDPLYHLSTIAGGISDAKREYVRPNALRDWAKGKLEETKNDPDAVHTKGAHVGKMKGVYLDRIKKYEKHIEFAEVYDRYEALRLERRYFDYEDMIIEVVAALENDPDFLLTLQEQYLYLLADEHQDANNAQNRLLNLLASYHQNPNIFVVGDPDQAIYRFQGASVANFLSFKTEYPAAEIISLRKNYRSAQGILDAMAPLSLQDSVGEGVGALEAAREKGSATITIVSAPDTLSEYAGVAERVAAEIAAGQLPSEIALLVRKNREAKALAGVFQKKNIPFQIVGGSNFFDEPLIRDFIRLIRALANFGDDALLAEALPAPCLGIDPLDLYKLFNTRRTQKIPLAELIRSKSHLVSGGVTDIDRILSFGTQFTKWKKNERAIPLIQSIETIAHESGFLACLVAATDSVEKLESYRSFFEYVEKLSAEFPDKGFAFLIERLDLMEKYRLKERRTALSMEGKVHIMTVHAAKGLEWNSVYILGAVEGNWEGMRARSGFSGIFEMLGLTPEEDESILDERRLFYVALSRARQSLTISYSMQNESGRELLPTAFIQEMTSDRIQTEEIDGEGGIAVLTTPIPQKNPAEEIIPYLKTLFLEEGLTPTALNNYLKDPWTYFFQNLLRLPATQKPHLMFGTAVHFALEEFFIESKRAGTFLGESDLLAFFRTGVDRQPFSERDRTEALLRGEKALKGFLESMRDELKEINLETLKGEYPLSGAIDLGGMILPLSGKIDRLEEVAGGFRVVDYKTGKPKSRNEIEGNTKSSDGSYKRQLVFYKLLLSLEGKTLRDASLVFVEPSDSGKYSRELFTITDQEIAELKDTIARVSKEIMTLAFWNMDPLPDNEYIDLVRALRERQ